MKVIYYTYPYFFDASLCFIRSLSELVDLHVILEITPENRRGPILDLSSIPIKSGISSAEPILAPLLPASVKDYWKNLSSFHLAVFNTARSIHPDTIIQGLAISKCIDNLHPDIIHFEDISLRTALCSFLFRKNPWVVGVHDYLPHTGEGNWRSSLSRKLMYASTKQFVLHNEEQRIDFMRNTHISPEVVKVIHLGKYDVYSDMAPWNMESMNNNILFFGRISPYKGLNVLFDAAVYVSKQLENVTFTVVGQPIRGYQIPQVPVLMNGCKFDIHFEHVSAATLGEYFQRATCVVCPYLDSTQSGVILTSYAFEKPVIATRTGGIPEYVLDGQSGLLIEPNNPFELGDAIIRLIDSIGLRDEMVEGIKKISQSLLNWDTICKQYHHLFAEITNHAL